MNREEQLNALFQKIVELYQISPEMATELLQRILTALAADQEKDESPESMIY